ncbi:MAG TPA: amidase, partial [Gammaproteobacteria bacterium]|nr:amidase [Gammaproteobacteria bacterium]
MVRAPMTTPVPQVTAFAPVHELIRKLRDGELTALQLTNLYLERIDRFDSKLNAYVSVLADHARAAAQSADRDAEAGRWRGPLHGIPFGVKDIIEYDGHQTTWGSMALEGRMSDHSAAVVTKLEAAGAIVIGKTQTVEFALGGWGTNQHRGTPWNPWDLETHRIPGGSSSGSGVASAAGLAAFTLGTDTGGSVRLPSAFCGLVGLKPTFGRVSNHGVMPLSTTLDSVGPLARCVEDAALIYNLMQGADSNDPVTTLHASVDPLPTLRNGIDGMRLAIMPKAERTHATAPVLAAYDQSLRVLQSLGAVLVNIELPCSFGDFRNAVSAVASAEGYATTCELMDQEHLPLDQHVRRRMLAGRDVSAKDYLHG